MNRYPRDLHGYGAHPPPDPWPDHARIAVQFVLNYEEGGERSLLHGDASSEAFLSEIVGAEPWPGQRHWNMESLYDYGARAGFWRLHRLFTGCGIPVTVFGVATALARSPAQVAAMVEAGWEIACHGLKWIEHKDMTVEAERRAMAEALRLHQAVVGEAARGWYTGRCSPHTVALGAEFGCFDYLSDSYADDLPYWIEHQGRDHLINPYTLDSNDMRFATAGGFNSGTHFFDYLRDAFDVLNAEGRAGQPKLLNVGLHCRLAGRPGRSAALARFIDHAQSHERVWFPRRIDIAEHWARAHPPRPGALRPSQLDQAAFLARFSGVFEGGAWIAERCFAAELGPANDTSEGLHAAMVQAFRSASRAERLAILQAHPDLAGKLARSRALTPESTREQAAAGLDALTDAEFAAFETANAEYRSRHGFPFIIAARDHDKATILALLALRMEHATDIEFAEACRQVERIAALRIKELLP
ncbi:MAG: allantoinase PuuE [Gammaproteobacteria bacterium]|nr:allantoinase PuuE [Gammaproteobacteria bacterium]